jgi:hypothetical protein
MDSETILSIEEGTVGLRGLSFGDRVLTESRFDLTADTRATRRKDIA